MKRFFDAATLASRQESFSHYFSTLMDQQKDHVHWPQGLAAVHQWVALTDDPNHSQGDVTRLLDHMHRGSSSGGSGWADLWMNIVLWATENGFDIPDNSKRWS